MPKKERNQYLVVDVYQQNYWFFTNKEEMVEFLTGYLKVEDTQLREALAYNFNGVKIFDIEYGFEAELFVLKKVKISVVNKEHASRAFSS